MIKPGEAMGDEENPTPEEGSDNQNAAPAAKEEDGHTPSAPAPASASASAPAPAANRNINSYYGHKIGFLQTLSLTLNAGLMVYAHVGLSAVILSSRDPSITANSMNTDGDGDNDVTTDTPTTINPSPGEGKCNAQDMTLWVENGGEMSRPEQSNFCSRTYNGGCFLDTDCIETCFQETYGYSSECSSCFGGIPGCSISSGCLTACAADSLGAECQQCNAPCIEELGVCTGLPDVQVPGKCNSQDEYMWYENGGQRSRPEQSNFCSRTYNGGCFLDTDCIETCFQETYGYSAECSSCFGVIPGCSISSGCLTACAADSLGAECQQCNAPCIEELGVCTGLPDLEVPGKCNSQDIDIWIENGGQTSRPEQSNYCSKTYNDVGCLIDSDCIETCFQETYGYSAECSSCFGIIPACSVRIIYWLILQLNSMHAFRIIPIKPFCDMHQYIAADSAGAECQECNKPCVEELGVCTGLPKLLSGTVITTTCNAFDLEAIDEWYTVYNLTFAKSINDAWNGDAKLLAVIIVVFSGIWPYLKNIMLVIIWYLPTSVERQTSTLLWLSRLSKYTLVDVFAVIGVLVGVQLQLNVGGTEAVTRAEPRFGIIAFFLATVWEFCQIELIKAMHERKVLDGQHSEAREERLLFSKLWVPVVILAASLALYISGAITEVVHFTSTDSTSVCYKSFNLVTLGNALINELSMTSNSAPGQTWILYLSYVILNLVFPILTHLLQICFIVGWFQSKKLKSLIECTLAIWCFACIEVLLIGVFAVEYKFPNLVMKIAGDSNASFLDVDSELGVGFYILIAYSIVAGLLQSSLRIRSGDPSQSAGEKENEGA
ncbi:hypothetical protein ACHAXR_011534 [Thalassiosira sp. AJA248-18]